MSNPTPYNTERELDGILHAIHEYDDQFSDFSTKPITIFRDIYDSIENALIGFEVMKKNDASMSQFLQKIELVLEARLVQAAFVLTYRDSNGPYHRKFIESPWGQRYRDKEYFFSRFENDPKLLSVLYSAIYEQNKL